jgi:hypothetical protein
MMRRLLHPARAPRRRIVAATLALWFACRAALPAVAEESADRYFRGLRERGLFSVAEAYCLRRLGEPDLLPAEKAALTVELSRTFADHAAYRAGAEQAELWQRAQSVVDDLLQQDPQNPRREAIELQAALVPAAHGALLAWQAELMPYDDTLRQQARARLQSAITGLRAVEARLAERTRTARDPTPVELADGALTPVERQDLSDEASFRVAAACVGLARLQSTGRERDGSLRDAETRLTDLARSRIADDRTWNVRILRIEAARLRDNLDQAAALAESLRRGPLPLSISDRVLAELVRVDLARQRPDEALQRLLDRQPRTVPLSEELRCLNVEALLQAWQTAREKGDQKLADDLRAEAERIDAELRSAWRARSRALLDTARDAADYGPELAGAMHAARAAFQNGDVPGSLEKFGQAIDQARNSGRTGLAGELQLNRGSILLQQGEHEPAATDFRAAADALTDRDQAAQAHLLYAFCLGKLWEGQRVAERREAYVAALAEHRTRFDGLPSALEAVWMQAALAEAERRPADAIAAYAAIPLDHARGQLARARIAALHEQVLDGLRAAGEPTAEWEAQAIAGLTAFLDTMPVPPVRLAPLEAEVALRMGRIILNQPEPDYVDADALLDRVIGSYQIAEREAARDQAPAIDPAWAPLYQAATQLRIVSLAGQDRPADALQVIDGLTQTDPRVLLAVLGGLGEVALRIAPERRRALGEVQVRAAERLREHRAALDAAGARRVDECLAEAYAIVGRPNDALSVYEPLLAQAPRDKRLLRAAAVLLSSLDKPERLEKARSCWRQLEKLEEHGSPAWFDARYEVAAVTLKLREAPEFRRLMSITRELYPELGGPELKQKFARLESQVQ